MKKFITILLIILLSSPCIAKAASGKIYTCKVTSSYSNPTTGQIEDSGGQSSSTTGQSMVEGCLGETGILEVTDDNKYYLSFRLGLMDYTTNHKFKVQNVGDSDWKDVKSKTTKKGSDNNGSNADICIEVPSENCLVRVSMYVTSMGRDVIFFLYPSDYTSGNTSDFKATMVTKQSKNKTKVEETTPQETTPQETTTQAQTQAQELNEAQGLSLSTAKNVSETTKETKETTESAGTQFLVLTGSITISGLILLAATTFVIYFCRKNWHKWGDDDDD